MRRLLWRAWLIGALLIVIVGGSGGISSQARADAPGGCSDLMLVFARGSGQSVAFDRSPNSESSKFFSEIRSHTPDGLSITEYRLGDPGFGGSSYPAVDWRTFGNIIRLNSRYDDSVREGRNELTALLTSRHSQCADEEWIIGGYSQGGQVISSTLRALPAAVRAHVGFAATFGDPTLEAYGGFPCRRAWYARGNVRCFQHGLLGPVSPYVPDDIRGHFGAWCDWLDPVCAMGPDPSAHGEYKNAAIPAAALEALSAVRFERNWTLRELVLGNGSTGVDVMVVFDTTGSMGGVIYEAQQAAMELAHRVHSLTNGRIGLVQYRDLGDEPPFELVLGLSSSDEEFDAAVSSLYADGGGDTPEAMLGGIMTALNGVDWRVGATKLVVVIADAEAKDPDPVLNITTSDVIARANEIDPVGVYGVDTCGCGAAASMESLAEGTGGDVIFGSSTIDETFDEVFADASARPVVQIPDLYYTGPGDQLTLSAEGSYDPDSTVAEYRWDLDGDGSFETTTTEPTVSHVYPTEGVVKPAVVAVSDDGGIGAGTTTVIVESDWEESLTPDAPTSVRAEEVGLGSVAVSWQPPSKGPAPTAYTIFDAAGSALAITDAGTKSLTLDGFEPGSRQRFSVQAIADGAAGPLATTAELVLSKPATQEPKISSPPERSPLSRLVPVGARILTKKTTPDGNRISVKVLCPRSAISTCKVSLSVKVPGQRGTVARRRGIKIQPGKVATVVLRLSGAATGPPQRLRLFIGTETAAGRADAVALIKLRYPARSGRKSQK